MYKENVFQLIRKEEVIIWVGAGMSMYAGYPSGVKLADILYQSLTEPEKSGVNPNLPLPNLAEEIYRIKGNKKNALIRNLKDAILNHKPASIEYHQKLAGIPHIKTIVTTNYDTLFERAYGDNAQVVIAPNQIPYLDKNKVQIFKAHGDLTAPDSVIVTNSDYNRFFKNNTEYDIFWTVIKERLATKSILFLGYNLEDPNVSVLFDKVSDALGSHMKESFLVAPNLPQHKIGNLISQGIQYINSNGEDFVEELLQNIKDNIIEDFDKGFCSADTFRKFLFDNNLMADLKSVSNSFKLAALSGINGNIEGNLDFTVKNDSGFISELKNFIDGKKFGEFEIPEDKLINTKMISHGLKLLGAKEGIALKLKSLPKIESEFDLLFDGGFELNDIPVKIFGSPYGIQMEGNYRNLKFWLKLDPINTPDGKIDLKFTHKDLYSRTKDEIEIHALLKNIASGQSFTIHHKSGLNFTEAFPIQEELLADATKFLDYFEKLQVIERNYSIRFLDINSRELGKESFELILIILSAINNQSITYHYEGEFVGEIPDISELTLEKIAVLSQMNLSLPVHEPNGTTVKLHGQEISLGFKKIEILDAYITNLDALRNKTENLGKFRSKTQKIKISYTKEPLINK